MVGPTVVHRLFAPALFALILFALVAMSSAQETPTSPPADTPTATATAVPTEPPEPTATDLPPTDVPLPTATDPPPTALPTDTPTETPTTLPTEAPTATPPPTQTLPPTAAPEAARDALVIAAATALTFAPEADAHVQSASPAANFGTVTSLTVDNSPVSETYLRFTVAGGVGTVQLATLRLWVTSPTDNGPAVFLAGNSWTETGITWNTKPARTGSGAGDLGAIPAGWVEFNVTPLVTGNGTFTFSLPAQSSDGLTVSSKEATAANRPQLVVTFGDGAGPTATTAPPTATGTSAPPTATGTTAPPTATSSGGQQTATFAPAADAHVDASQPTGNFGTATTLTTDSPNMETYLRFSVSGVGTVQRALLRLWVTNATTNGPAVFLADNNWTETGITWNTKPARTGSGVADKGNVPAGWVEFDVTALVTGNGTFTLSLPPQSSDGLVVSSKESATNRPELIVTSSSGSGPTATSVPPTPTTGPTTVPPTNTPIITPTPTTPAGGTVVVMAAGDIVCGAKSTNSWCQQSATANVIEARSPNAVLALGDVQYECAQAADFATYFDPTWGRFKSKIYPSVGNHEYKTSTNSSDPCYQSPPNARDYFNYFGPVAGDPSKGYYSFDLGAWHLISLNSNCAFVGGCGAGSAQEQWLRADLAAHPNTCTLAFMHYPRFSSVAPFTSMQPFWQALYDAGAEVVLTAHDHHYERYGPRTPSGANDPAFGISEIMVGTGGKQPNQGFGTKDTPLVKGTTMGVLEMTLRPTSYDWRFVPVAGQTWTDTGSGTCHGAPSAVNTTDVAQGSVTGDDGSSPTLHAADYAIGPSSLVLWIGTGLLLVLRWRPASRRRQRAQLALIRSGRLYRARRTTTALAIGIGMVPLFATAAPVAAAEPIASAPGIEVTRLGQVTLDAIPPSPAVPTLARFAFEPGARMADVGVPGPLMIVQETGAVAVEVRGETENAEEAAEAEEKLVPATPGPPQMATPVVGQFTYTLHPGDRLLVPADTPHSISNAGETEARFLAATVTPPLQAGGPPWPPAGSGPAQLPDGVMIELLGTGPAAGAEVPPAPAEMRLDRVRLAPGQAQADLESTAVALWYVEEGTLGLSVSQGEVTTGNPATAIPTGREVTVEAGNAAFLPLGAAASIRNAGSAPAVALVLSIGAG